MKRNAIHYALAVCALASPFASQAANQSQEMLELSKRACCNKRPEAQSELIKAFEKLQIDIHDLILANYYALEVPPLGCVVNDLLGVGVQLTSLDVHEGNEFFVLLTNYTFSLLDYQIVPLLCTVPSIIPDEVAQLQQLSRLLADFIITRNHLRGDEAAETYALFAAWTDAQVGYINNAAPSCENPSFPVDAAASNEAYTRVRGLTYLIAKIVYKTLNCRGG